MQLTRTTAILLFISFIVIMFASGAILKHYSGMTACPIGLWFTWFFGSVTLWALIWTLIVNHADRPTP